MEHLNEEAPSRQHDDKELNTAQRYPVSFSIFALARSHRALAGQMLRDIGLFPGQEIMLLQLWDKDGQSQQSLGRTIGVDHSTVAKSVKRLEESGLVTRTRSPEDGRVTLVWLTEAGRSLEAKVNGIWEELERITVNGLTEAERKQLAALAQRIASSVDSAIKN
ncbi:MarR family winged helix-turn-helix transcriptional regulator [Paenibacillus xanthanilyticus]|uniref:MarR family winged helix-turn-helix transcriptional regulator n=1 Tax=Paenibacillus xanthanilyticus TaxID=1783531 RepID=A0ABV8K8S7_9BACL